MVSVFFMSEGAAAQPGYGIGGNQVVVDSPSHWKNWEFAEGTLEITPSGELRPRRWRRRTNAVLDIADHLRWNPPGQLARKDPASITLLDAVQGVSNRRGVVNVLDGDATTYWEPEILSDDVELATQWWFTVDLGRIVLVDRIVLKFVDESLGDPFYLFEVLVSNGQAPGAVPVSRDLDFRPVIQTLWPNKNQRVFEADFTEFDPLAATESAAVNSASRAVRTGKTTHSEYRRKENAKRSVRFVQVVVRGSDRDRGREIGEEAYRRLLEKSPEEAGAVEYLKRLSNGGEATLDSVDYERLSPSLRGGIRYFRRERPRLAELEVWSPGDDLASGVIRRKGSIVNSSYASAFPLNLIDGNIQSHEIMTQSNYQDPNRLAEELSIDLGSYFWISGLRLAGGRGDAYHAILWRSYRLDYSDGSREGDGSQRWVTLAERNADHGRIALHIEEFPPVIARFFRVQWDLLPEYFQARLGELQLYGEGYQPRVELTSSLIQLGAGRNLTTIEWDSDRQPGTRVEVQTRTGNTLDTLLRYYKADGKEISRGAYNKIRLKSQKGDAVPELVASPDWEPWSEPYELPSGSAVTSPSPRKYLKIRARLLSDDPDAFATLGAVRVNFSEALADSLKGQVIPARVDSLGVERNFSLFVEVGPLKQRFDAVLVTPPPGMELSFDPGRESVFAGPASAFVEGGDLDGLRLQKVRVESDAPDSLRLGFDALGREVEMLRVDFRGVLLAAGGRLRAYLRNSQGDGSWQRVDEKVPRSSLQLIARPGNVRPIRDVKITPPVFTPNGDGVNDELRLDFTVVMVGAGTAVVAEVFDLRGLLVRRLEERREIGAGTYSMAWNGRDEAEKLVPPGVYAVRVKLASGSGPVDVGEQLRAISLAY